MGQNFRKKLSQASSTITQRKTIDRKTETLILLAAIFSFG